MKKVYSGIVVMLTISIFWADGAGAQIVNNASDLAANNENSSQHWIKKDSSSLRIHPKAIREFRKYYSNATGTQWTAIGNEGFVCRFLQADNANRAYYNKIGNWICTVSDLSEKNMPQDLRQLVRTMYIDYSILFVQEIILPEGYEPIYKIQIQNEKKFVVLKVIDGEIGEVLRSNL